MGSEADDVFYLLDLDDYISCVTEVDNQLTDSTSGGSWQETKCHLM